MDSAKSVFGTLKDKAAPYVEKLIKRFSEPRRLILLAIAMILLIKELIGRFKKGSKTPSTLPKNAEVKMVQGKNFISNSENKPLLLVAFATWCQPCKRSVPGLNKIHKENKDVNVMGVSGEKEEEVKKYIAENKPSYAVGYVEGEGKNVLFNSLKIRSYPSAFLFDTEGNQLWSGHPMSGDLISKLEAIKNKEGEKK